MPDDNTATPSVADDVELKTAEAETDSAPATDAAETSEHAEDQDRQLPPKTQKRIQQLLEQRKQAQSVADWYRENIGDPNEVVAFRKWKDEQAAAAAKENPPASAELTPDKIKAVRDLVYQAVPELKSYEDEKKNQRVAMVERGGERIEELAKEAGMPDNAEWIQWIGQNVGMEINSNESLSRAWAAGDITAVERAFKKVQERLGIAGRKATADLATTKRKVTKLPTVPSGGGSTVSAKPAPPKGKGFDTPGLADRAWAILQREAENG